MERLLLDSRQRQLTLREGSLANALFGPPRNSLECRQVGDPSPHGRHAELGMQDRGSGRLRGWNSRGRCQKHHGTALKINLGGIGALTSQRGNLLNICIHQLWLPRWLSGKESAAEAGDSGDTSLIPGSGRSLEEMVWQPSPVFFPGKAHGQRSLANYRPWGHKESDTTETCAHIYQLRSPQKNSMDWVA